MKKEPVEIYKSESGAQKGPWRFRIRSRNGRILCASEGYTSKQAAQVGISALRKVLNRYW